MKDIPLHHYITYLTKEAIRDNARMLGERIPISWNKERMSLALAAIYKRDPSVFLRMLSESTIAFTYLVFSKKKLNYIDFIISLPNSEVFSNVALSISL